MAQSSRGMGSLAEQTAIALGEDGSAWTGSADGKLERWDPNGDSKLVARLPLGPIGRMVAGRGGRVWARARGVVLCGSEGQLKSWPLPEGFGNGSAYEPVIEDAHGGIW